MFSFKIGITTVNLWPLIIIFLIEIIGAMFYAIFRFKRNKKLMELCRTGEYNDSIVLAKKQLNHYSNLLKNKKTKIVIEMIHLHLAISYLGLSNDEQFIHNIAQVADGNLGKHFWLALFYILKKDQTQYQTQYRILSSKGMNENYLTYLSSLNKLQECDDADARAAISALNEELNIKLLYDISQKIIDQ